MCTRLLILLLVAATVSHPAWAQTTASDIAGHWAEDRVSLLVQRNIASLFPDQTFHPDEEISRGEFMAWLVIVVGLPPRAVRTASFADVPPSHPLSPYIEAALEYGLTSRTPAFLPSAPIARADTIVTIVRTLGYSFEAAALSRQALPFDDVGALPEPARGAIAVALQTDPPLLKEPASSSVRPQDPMTRAEAASLVGGSLLALENGIVLRSISSVHPGVDVVVEKRGVLRALPTWRVQVGAFTSEENAQRLAAAMRDRGLPVVIDFLDGFYKVRVGSFASAVEAMFLKDQLTAEGFPTWIIQTLRSFEGLAGPFRTAALVVDPRAGLRLVPAFGDGQRMRRQRISELARRAGALAATNGGFFAADGNPLGCLVVSGEVVSAPDPQRTCAGITEDGTIAFDRVRLEATVTVGDSTMRIDGVNRGRGSDELILYRPVFDLVTRTNQFGAEATVVGDAVTGVVDLHGNTPIPRDGYVLSGHGRARQWILQMLRPGVSVSVRFRFIPASGDPRWDRVVHAIGGGPQLLAAGQYVGGEGFPVTFTDRRHPRTALGVLADGRILLLVVDGRQPFHSLGMTLVELAMELRRLGAVDAMNLDGGGSATMVVDGRVVNLPSDETGERAVADGLLVLPAAQSP